MIRIRSSAGKIHSLFVHPEFQGQGVGSKLLAKLELTATDAKTNVIWLSSSVAAKGFYAKFGYSLVRSENSSFGITFLMEKRLAQNL
jgi:ribosomal protein S18 acetylase RimI-like enzyme